MKVSGERKVPGGKLVRVDGRVEEGHLVDVVVSGDFFLEPDEALDDIRGALEGLPVDTGFDAVTAKVETARGAAVMFGFEPKDVALTVFRALGRATTWEDHEFELVDAGPLEPLMQMAVDEVLARQVAEGRRKPALRIWDWASSAVIIGSYQSLTNEVDLEAAAEHDIAVVRRVSGGGAMFVEPGNTITYSLYVPTTLVAGQSFAESYKFLDAWVLRALRGLGVDADYVSLNDIASPQGKIGGAAQKRFAAGGVLHHVTAAYDIDAQKMTEVLRIGREKLSDKGTKSAAKRVDPMRSQTGLERHQVIEALVAEFDASYGLTPVPIDEETLTEAKALVESKFATAEWLQRIP
ncbi:lipoate--protein ligase family protein [Nocardioides daphniae]|uniref:Lipoate--protein ligase A n=1 Tax=Nocardioides daphniae TaxID=402297 RepID=A0ABQ1Q1R9_9ACTN|nr:biotin/lipoate A/B protein ligase family protein [Nocardioides daphniae]GGD10168.1 lipoate--protein ligase A [Nocardioides daphniae]